MLFAFNDFLTDANDTLAWDFLLMPLFSTFITKSFKYFSYK